MLNELFSIERAFAANGDPVDAAHPDIKDMAKGPAFRLRLSADARLVAVELIEDAGRGAVWTLRDGQHNGFPGLKTKAGLLDLGADELARHDEIWKKRKAAADRRAELQRLAQSAAPRTALWPEAGHRKRIAERLAQLGGLAQQRDAAAVLAVFDRFLRAVDASPPLLTQLTQMLIEALDIRGDAWLESIRSAFIGAAPLVIDAASGEFPYDASDPRQIAAVSAALSQGGAASGRVGVCALSGHSVPLHHGNYPQPNLPGLGQSYLYSRNADIPSLERYGRIAESSFSVGSDLVNRLGGVLSKLTQQAQEGQTWRLIPAEAGDKLDLILCSLSIIPELGDADEAQGEAVAQGGKYFAQARGEKDIQPGVPPDVSILILRTVDPANRKAIYSRRVQPQRIEQAALGWRRAMRNLPETIGFVMPRKGERAVAFAAPGHVGPLSLTPLTRALFANAGRRRLEIIGLSAAEAMALFLCDGDEGARARSMLRAFLRRYAAMLIHLAGAARQGVDALKDVDPRLELRRYALRALSWFGALLHVLDRPKERYMDDCAFRLGQFLSGADLLHIGYCADRRNGEVPPVLVGASVMSLAAGNPVRALAVICQRIKPYRDWMRSGRFEALKRRADDLHAAKKENSAIAIRTAWVRARQMDEASVALETMLKPYETREKKPDDAFKAELLLGYLAGFPKSKKSPKDGSDTDDQGEEI